MNETQAGGDTIGSLAPGFEQPSNPWSDKQVATLDGLKKLSTVSSVVGSSLIIFMILKRRKSTTIRTTYNRLLFSLSVADLIASCACLLGALPVPANLPIEGAKGNTTTCNIQAFFMHLCYCATCVYNTALMIYFALTVVYEMKDGILAARVEPFMHIVAILFPLVGAVTALLLDSFNLNLGVGACWIDSYPPGCLYSDSMPCTRGQHAHVLYMVFVLAPGYVMMAVLYTSIYLIYQAVKRRERLAQSFRDSTGASELSSASSMIMLRSARTKAMMFATVFVATYGFTVLVGTIAWRGKVDIKDAKYSPVFMLIALLFPLQGFLNFIVYIHPRFMRIRRMRKDKSFLWVLWKSITLETIVAHPAKSSTKTGRLSESLQTERADHTVSHHVTSSKEEQKQNEADMIKAQTIENQVQSELDNN